MYPGRLINADDSGVPSKSAARGGDLKCRLIIYNSNRPTVGLLVSPYIKSKKSEIVKFTIMLVT